MLPILIEFKQNNSTDYIAITSLAIAIIAWPIVYFLGSRTAVNAEFNKYIDTLEVLNKEIFDKAAVIFSQNLSSVTASTMSDYFLMISYSKRLQNVCFRLEELKKKFEYPQPSIISIKRIITNEIFENNSNNDTLARLLIDLDMINRHYKKSFY